MNKETRKLYTDAIAFYGADRQINKLTEECGELIKAINKFRLNPSEKTLKELCGEIADVEVALEQARIITGESRYIDAAKLGKQIRLRKRILASNLTQLLPQPAIDKQIKQVKQKRK
jgi:NTP pyrophosphatase (non-canonical NTP hydrolase)